MDLNCNTPELCSGKDQLSNKGNPHMDFRGKNHLDFFVSFFNRADLIK